MKSKIIVSVLGFLTMFMLIVVWTIGVNANKSLDNNPNLILQVSSEKQAYVQGEIVKLNFELINRTNEAIKLPVTPDVSTGYLKVLISSSNQDFKQYHNSKWGLKEGGRKTIQAGQSFKSQATLLWNSKPQVAHLNIDAAKRASEGKILTLCQTR